MKRNAPGTKELKIIPAYIANEAVSVTATTLVVCETPGFSENKTVPDIRDCFLMQ